MQYRNTSLTERQQMPQGEDNSSESAQTDPGSLHDAERKMREALLGMGGRRETAAPRQHSDSPRQTSHRQSGERASASGSGHRHRFVQDGEVPVVMVTNTNAASSPTGAARASETRASRQAPTAADLNAERGARERTERALQQAQAVIRDLETKLAHAEMARTDAQNAAKTAKEGLATLRAQSVNEVARLNGLLADERSARQKLELRIERAQGSTTASVAAPAAEPRVKRAYTKRKRYPLADATEMAGGIVQTTPAAQKLTETVAEPVDELVTDDVAEFVAPAPRQPRAKRVAEPKPPKVKREPEPKPVKWWVKPRT